MQKLTTLLFYLAFFYQITLAQVSGNVNRANTNYTTETRYFETNPISAATFTNDSTLVLAANVLMNVKADEYVAILSITQFGATVKICNEAMDSRINLFINELIKKGFAKENIFSDFISQVPTYEYEIEKKIFSKTANEVPTGFELKKNVHIAYTKNTDLDKIMLIAADFEIYDLVKVDYLVKNMETVYDTLRSKSTAIIQKKVKLFKNLNINFNPENLRFQTIAEDIGSAYPEERYKSYTAFSSTGIKKNVKYQSTDIQKNVSFYYDKVRYNQYDLVINPVILEPAVQFSYTLLVKYSLKKK